MRDQGGPRKITVAALLLAAAATLTACGREDPAETRADIAAAETTAAQRTAEAREQAAGQRSAAQHEAADSLEDGASTGAAQAQVARASAESAHDVAVAQAEGAHEVATERCDALAGDARRSCRERADLELERARTAARQARDGPTARAP